MARFTIQSVFSAVDQLSGPVKTMRGQVGAFGKDAKKALDGVSKTAGMLKGAIVGAAAALTTGAISKAVGDFAERGDDIARNAGILGMTAEAYQELSYAANMADVEQEAFASAAKKLNNNLGQLKTGTGALYSTLAKTNPQLARQLKNAKDSDAAFQMMSDAIAGETNVQKRAALAQAAFGKTGQDLIPMMEGLADARKKARESGAVMSDEEVDAASRMDDALKKIKISGMGLANTALSSIASRLAPVIEGMTTWLNANRDLINQRIDQVFKTIGTVAKIIGAAWKSGLLPAILGGAIAFKAITGAIAAYKAIMGIATIVQTALNVAMNANPVGLIIIGIAALTAAIIFLVFHWREVLQIMKDFSALLLVMLGPIGTAINLIRVLATNFTKIVDAFKNGGFIEGFKAIGATIMQFLIQPFAQFMSLLSKIPGIGEKIAPFAQSLTSISSGATPISSNTRGIESRSISESRSSLDVNFNGAPAGTSFAQRGSSPGITINQFSTVGAR